MPRWRSAPHPLNQSAPSLSPYICPRNPILVSTIQTLKTPFSSRQSLSQSLNKSSRKPKTFKSTPWNPPLRAPREAEASPGRPPRQCRGLKRPASNSPSAESPGSSRKVATPSASAPDLRSTSPPSSNTSPPRFVLSRFLDRTSYSVSSDFWS